MTYFKNASFGEPGCQCWGKRHFIYNTTSPSANREESQGEELDLQEFDAVAETEGGLQAHVCCCSHAVHQVPEQRK